MQFTGTFASADFFRSASYVASSLTEVHRCYSTESHMEHLNGGKSYSDIFRSESPFVWIFRRLSGKSAEESVRNLTEIGLIVQKGGAHSCYENKAQSYRPQNLLCVIKWSEDMLVCRWGSWTGGLKRVKKKSTFSFSVLSTLKKNSFIPCFHSSPVSFCVFVCLNYDWNILEIRRFLVELFSLQNHNYFPQKMCFYTQKNLIWWPLTWWQLRVCSVLTIAESMFSLFHHTQLHLSNENNLMEFWIFSAGKCLTAINLTFSQNQDKSDWRSNVSLRAAFGI